MKHSQPESKSGEGETPPPGNRGNKSLLKELDEILYQHSPKLLQAMRDGYGRTAAFVSAHRRPLLRRGGLVGGVLGLSYFIMQRSHNVTQDTKVILLDTPTGAHKYDVVFIHGLTGDPIRTWVPDRIALQYNAHLAAQNVESGEPDKQNWEDPWRHGSESKEPSWLPQALQHFWEPSRIDVPGNSREGLKPANEAMKIWINNIQEVLKNQARILTVAYPSTNIDMNLDCMAREVANALVLDAGIGKKETIYICHSMGGVLLKKVLTLPDTEMLKKCTSVVAFYGTPHRGTATYQTFYYGASFLRYLGIWSWAASAMLFSMRKSTNIRGGDMIAFLGGSGALSASSAIPAMAHSLGDVVRLREIDEAFFVKDPFTRDVRSVTFLESAWVPIVHRTTATPYSVRSPSQHITHTLNHSHRSMCKPESMTDTRNSAPFLRERLLDLQWEKTRNSLRPLLQSLDEHDVPRVEESLRSFSTKIGPEVQEGLQRIRAFTDFDPHREVDAKKKKAQQEDGDDHSWIFHSDDPWG